MDEREFTEWLLNTVSSKQMMCKKNTNYALATGRNNNIWLVEKGVLLSTFSGEDGSSFGTAVHKSNALIGITSFNHDNRTIMCKPLVNSILRRFSTREVSEQLMKNISACYYMLEYVCKRYTITMTMMEDIFLKTLDERIYDFDLMMTDIKKEEGDLLISDAILAEYFGKHPVTISRARKKLLDKKIKEHSCNKHE